MQGYIEKISQKSGNGANGPWTMYSIQVGGNWYSCGFKPVPAKEGDYVNFDVVQKGKYTNATNVAPVAAPAASSGGGNNSSSPAPVNTRDISISFQHCQKEAHRILDVFLRNDVVKLPAKQADKYDAAMGLLYEISASLYVQLAGVIENGGVSAEDLVEPPMGEE